MRESILLNGYPLQERADCREIQRRSHNPATKASHVFVDGRGVRTVGSDLFEVSEQFHEAYVIRITDGRFTIWLHPFWMLDPEVLVDLPPKLGVSVNVVSHCHWLGETHGRSRMVLPKPRRRRPAAASRARVKDQG